MGCLAVYVGGVGWVNIADICRVLAILCICWIYSSDPVGVPLWWTHKVCTSWLSILGSSCISGGFIGSSYVIVCDIMWGLRLWYQLWSSVTRIVIVCGIFLDTSRAQLKGLLGLFFHVWVGISMSLPICLLTKDMISHPPSELNHPCCHLCPPSALPNWHLLTPSCLMLHQQTYNQLIYAPSGTIR